MNRAFLLLVFLCAWCPAFCDTIPHWQVYRNGELVGRFNLGNERPELTLTLKESDTLRIRYSECTGRVRSFMVYVPSGDSSFCWGDGDYYSERSPMVRLHDAHDAAYWDEVFEGHGRGEAQLLAKDLLPVLAQTGGSAPFYYTDLYRHDRHFGETLLFVLHAKHEE